MIKKNIIFVLAMLLIVFCFLKADKYSKQIISEQKQVVSPLLLSMGGFRNIISDVLMFRLQYFIEENEFVEVQYLSQLIGELNPDSANLTVFNAWNLAYNVTIVIPDKQTKWYFLNSAIELLAGAITDENSKKNARLRYELAILLLNKLSNVSQEETFYVDLWNEKYNLKKSIDDNHATFGKLKIDINIAKQLEDIYGEQDWRTSTPYIRYNAFMAKDKIGENWQENIKVLLK